MSGETKIDKSINIKGEVCPYTFVRSKLAIESLSAGEVLEVVLDYEPASVNVPKSLTNEGHSVLSLDKINNTDWRLVVRKKS